MPPLAPLVPPRRLVALYLVTAHVSLACAFLLTAWNPGAIAGFFYHARIVAVVHLITLGWIAMSILGVLYVVVPMTCGVALPARRGDYGAYALVTIGLVGLVVHFWIGEFGGMAWSAVCAALGILHVAVRASLALRRSAVPAAMKLHVYLATANLTAAVVMAVLLGFDKVRPFLGGYVLSNVFAHAHAAAIGWVSMTMVGFGFRLLPMVLPSAVASGRSLYRSAVLFETGIAGLFVSLLTRSAATPVFALVIVAAFANFAFLVFWMLEHPRRRPPNRSHADFAVHHLAAAGASLFLACLCGVILVLAPMSEWTLHVAALYGVLGLVGFLAQAIVGFERRILPVAASYWSLHERGVIAPVRTPPRPVSLAIFVTWLCGVPLVAAGLFLDHASMLAAGAWLLFGGVVLMLADLILVLKQKGRRP